MSTIRIDSKLFPSWSWLSKALSEDAFKKLPAPEQVWKLGKLFREHVGSDEKLSEKLMTMIRWATIFATGSRELSEDDIMKISPYEMELITKLSKKKIALARFKLVLWNYYDSFRDEQKQDLYNAGITKEIYINKQTKEIYRQFSGISNEVIDTLWNSYDLAFDVKLFLWAFDMEEWDTSEPLHEVCMSNWWMSPDFFIDLWLKHPYLGINTRKIQKENFYQDEEVWRLTWNYLESLDEKKEDKWTAKNWFINPNWFLYDIDVESAFKLWWAEKTKYIFGNYFYSGIKNMKISKDISLPDFYNYCLFRIKVDEDAEWNKKKLVDIAQHIYEWELPKEFSHTQFSALIKNIRVIISDLQSSGEPRRFDHPIQTSLGTKKYTWYFSGSKWFENTHIIDIQWSDKNGKRKLRFATELWQDTTLYVLLQISYFLKNWTTAPSSQIWREIYTMYNQLSMEGVERFDPLSMKSQYDTLVQKVIWPISREHQELKWLSWKSHNVLLYGVYWTGKSQLLTHLLAEREYTINNNKKIHLEANVINIGIMEFAELLVKSVSSFRKRLSDIHENTWLPIILVIEDIDTIIKEAWIDSDPVSQALTTLFEWVGSLPVIVVASTNNPETLPQRHLRPNRIDTLISFSYPLSIDSISSILEVHWKKKELDTILSWLLEYQEIRWEILDRIHHFTPSHISAFCLAVYEALEFQDIENLSKESLKNIIFNEISNCLVPINDMLNREKWMKKWRDSLGSKWGSMWFIPG